MKSMSGFGGGVASLGMRGISDPGYTDWGGGLPVWDKTSSTVYTINSPSYSGLDISIHYGMTTDSFNRYLIFTNRFGGTSDYTIWVPITDTGAPDFNARFGVLPPNYNYFGALADTVRGRIYHCEYSNGNLVGQDLPSTLSGLSAGNYASISGNTKYTLAAENAPNLTWPGTSAVDGGYHDGWNDIYYFVGRNNTSLFSYNPNTSSWTNHGSGSGWNAKYGICKDPSSNYFIYSRRDVGWEMFNGVNGSNITTYASGFTSFPNNAEDSIIAWNGDVYTWYAGSSTCNRWTRTA